jgi:hypothetical protein
MINLAQQKVYYHEKLELIISHVITWMRTYCANNLCSTHPKLGEAQAEFLPNWNIIYEQLRSQQKHQNSMLFGAQTGSFTKAGPRRLRVRDRMMWEE